MKPDPSTTEDRDRWSEQVARLGRGGAPARRAPLSEERIVDAALELVRAEGYDALTMRRVAGQLGSSPGAIYAHVRDKGELDDLMLGAVCRRIEVPAPQPAAWLEQAVGVCRQLRDCYLEYPGLSRVALGAPPRSVDTLRLFEGLLAVLTAAGIDVRRAAWAVDAAFAYIAAYGVVSLRRGGSPVTAALDRAEVVARLEMLPPTLFPIVTRHARDITAGEGHERFDFTLRLLFGGLGAGPGT